MRLKSVLPSFVFSKETAWCLLVSLILFQVYSNQTFHYPRIHKLIWLLLCSFFSTNWINMSLMRWTPGEQTRITLLTPFINSDKYRSNEFTNSETLYESENNSNRVWKREITKLRKSLLYPLSEWAVKAIICLSFHLHTLFVIYVCMWV